MSIGSRYRTGQKSPVPGIYRCEQCESAGVIADVPLRSRVPPCSRCRAAGRPCASTYRLVEALSEG